MSDETKPSTPGQLDLSELRLMPSWVANFGSQTSLAKYEEREDRPRGDRRDRGGDRGSPRGPGGGGGGERRPFGGGGAGGERKPFAGGGGKPGGGGPPRFGRRDDRGAPPPRFQDEAPQMPTSLKVTVEAEDKALDALAGHVKSLGRAFSVFDAARLVLAGPERHRVKVECEGERLVGLFQVQADGALFETREEALRYLLRAPEVISTYYSVEDVELEEPKGNFTTIAICGKSGELLAPPSHHSYQTMLKKLHTERYSDMHFEDYKRQVRMETSPEVVEKWKAQQRKGTKWTYLKGQVAEGEEPVSFTSKPEFEAHFRKMHGDDSVSEVREAIVHATAKREQLSPGLGRLLRRNIEEAKKHLFELSQKISHGLERRGLKLFKRRGGKMFVSKVKPRAIDPGTVFSERIKAIVERIRSEPGVILSKALADLAPAPALAEGETPATEPTEDQKVVLRDLHWLAEEGYVIIYSDDVLFLGVQGEPPHHTPEAKALAAATADTPTESEAAAPEAEAPAPAPAAEATEAPAGVAEEPAPPAVEPVHAAEATLPTEEEEASAAEANEKAAPDPSGAD